MPPDNKPNRVQFPVLKKEDFQTDHGVSMFNIQLSQLATTINAILGDGGRTVFPAGLDVQGQTVSNIGPPASPTDAVNQGHVAANYGSPTQKANLDIGGSHALTGATYAYAKAVQNQPIIDSFQSLLAGVVAYVGGTGSIVLAGGGIIKFGHTAVFTGTQAVTFAAAFPHACEAAFAVDDYASAAQRSMSVDQSTVTAAGFTIVSSGAGNGAYYFAIGY